MAEVVILEDDAAVDPDFIEFLNRRGSLPPDWELVLLYHDRPLISFWGGRRLGRLRSVKFASPAWGTVGYLLRRSGAEKLLAHGSPVRVPADHLTGGSIRTGVRLYGIDPPCVRELSGVLGGSTISAEPTHRERPSSREGLVPIFWILHRWKWWLIHLYRRVNPRCVV